MALSRDRSRRSTLGRAARAGDRHPRGPAAPGDQPVRRLPAPPAAARATPRTRSHRARRRRRADNARLNAALVAVIGDDADRLRLPVDQVADLIRGLVFTVTHPLIGATFSSEPRVIVDTLLYGIATPTHQESTPMLMRLLRQLPAAVPVHDHRHHRARHPRHDGRALPAQPERVDHRRRRGHGRHRVHLADRRDHARRQCGPDHLLDRLGLLRGQDRDGVRSGPARGDLRPGADLLRPRAQPLRRARR